MDRYDYWSILDDITPPTKPNVDWQVIAKNLYSIIQQGTKMPVHLGVQYINDYLKATRD